MELKSLRIKDAEPMRLHCSYPLRGETKHSDVKMICLDHVGKTKKKSDWFDNEGPE